MILGNSIAIPLAKTGRWPSRTLPRIGKTRKSTSFNRGVNCKASKKQAHAANSVVQLNQMEIMLENVINLQLTQNLQVSVTWLAKQKLVQRSEEIFLPSSTIC
jgi:hypothetical protein